jgi:hypothetical protein
MSTTLAGLMALLPKSVELTYVDYRDNLDEHLEVLQDVIQRSGPDVLHEMIDEWFWEGRADALEEILGELETELERRGIAAAEAETLVQGHRDALCDEIYSRDTSTPLTDLLRHTSKQTMFYDAGYGIEEDTCFWSPARTRLERIRIKKFLGIKVGYFDKRIDNMLCEASYGGRLVVYFYDDVERYFELEDYSSIAFTDACIAIINTSNGSGADIKLGNVTVTLPLDPESVYIDATLKYNYTFAVCGMNANWCECTGVAFGHERVGEKRDSSLKQELALEAHYAKVYREGGCTPGDMDYKRHRHVSYSNNPPCGSRCADCGTFWID